MFLNTIARRYATMPQVPVHDSDCTDLGQLRCKASTFQAEHGSTSSAATGVESSLLASKRSRSSPKTLSHKQLSLVKALLLTPRASWPDLWLGVFMRAGTVISKAQDSTMFLVVLATTWLTYAIKLLWSDDLLGYIIAPDCMWHEFAISDWSGLTIHEFDIKLSPRLEFVICAHEPMEPLDFILRHTVHLHSGTILRKVVVNRVAGWFMENDRFGGRCTIY